MLITIASAYDLDYNAPGICRNFTGKEFAKEVRHLFPTMPIALLEYYPQGYDEDGVMRFSHLFREHSSLIEWILSKPVVPNV